MTDPEPRPAAASASGPVAPLAAASGPVPPPGAASASGPVAPLAAASASGPVSPPAAASASTSAVAPVSPSAPAAPPAPTTDSAGEPVLGDAGRPEPEQAPTLTGDEARNVVMVQTSTSTWDVRVSGSDEVVGTIAKTDDDYRATDARGDDLGLFASPELAMFGVVTKF